MSIRKILFWMHLVAGCIGGLIILLMSITGVLLTYERQVLAWAERGPYRNSGPTARAARIPVEQLLAVAGEQLGGLPPNASLTVRSDPREPAELAAGRDSTVYIDPYLGQVLGKPSTSWRHAAEELRSWHRWIGAKGEGRTTAKAITGACNLAFLLLVLSGPFLWLPKQWSMQHLAPITWFRRGISGKARDFNWHNVFGIWCVVPLVFVVLSATPMSYTWANNLIYRMTGTEAPAGPGGRGGEGQPGARVGRGGPRSESRPMDLAGLNRVWMRAQAQQPGWQSINMRLPESPRRPVVFTIDTGDGGQPQKRSTLTVDRATASVVRWETFADQNTGRRLRSWSRFVHTGEAYGLPGQTIAGVASAGGVMLVWTGIALSLRRFAGWRKRRNRQEQQVETPVRVA